MSEKLLSHFHDTADDLIFWTFRYFLGRMTIAACGFAEDLARAWPDLEQRTQNAIKRELEQEFARDDRSRTTGLKRHPLGQNCNRMAWSRVRGAYTGATQ